MSSLVWRLRLFKLSLEGEVEVADPPDLLLNGLPFFADLQLVGLHPLVHLVEGVPFVVKVTVLLGQDLFVLLQEVSELIKLGVFEDLEASEGSCDLVWWWNLCHLSD